MPAPVLALWLRSGSRRHGICTSRLYRWRRKARGEVPSRRAARVQRLPVRVVAPDAAPAPFTSPPLADVAPTPIEVALRNGRVPRVAVTTDAAAVARFAAALEA